MVNTIKPLTELKAEMQGIIHHFEGGKELINRLLVLGFTIGPEVIVLQNYGIGPIILLVKDSRVALGRGEAKKVIVEVIK